MKRMKNYIVTILLTGIMLSGCYKEDTPTPVWEYPGPTPEITNGPAEAQKMCYQLYQKYDLHVYYTLSGKDALRTETGEAQTAFINTNNPSALPMQAADEATAQKFLKLLTRFCELLPAGLPERDLHKRHVLVKVNPSMNKFKTDTGEAYWFNAWPEDAQAIVFHGYLDHNDDEEGDRFDTRLKDWKWGICYEFFRGLVYYEKLPSEFTSVSKGMYFYEDMSGIYGLKLDFLTRKYVFYTEKAKQNGFVNPMGMRADSELAQADWASYIAWILLEPKAERMADLQKYEKLKQKYDIVMQYCKDVYKIDLEDLAPKWQAVTID